MSESKTIIAESIIDNFEAISSYVVRQSLRDMIDENQALRDECARLRARVKELEKQVEQLENAILDGCDL